MSELNAPRRKRNPSTFWRVYMLSWAALAGGALTYLSVFALHPDTQGTLLSKPNQSNQESNRADLDRAQLTAQVRTLHETVASLRTDIARFQDARTENAQAQQPQIEQPTRTANTVVEGPLVGASSISTAAVPQPEQQRGLTAKPAVPVTVVPTPVVPTIVNAPKTVEPAPTTIAADASPKAPQSELPTVKPEAVTATTNEPTSPTANRSLRNLATSPLRPGRLPPVPSWRAARAAILAPANSFSSIQTGSLPVATRPAVASSVKPAIAAAPKIQAPAFGQPTVKPRALVASAALSLSSASSITGLRASWLVLTTQHGNVLQGYQPRYIPDNANGTYRLLAGPFASHTEADRVCNSLRNQSVTCGVTTFAGTPL